MLEYFIATPGARKGLVDTALRTADSGYLTAPSRRRRPGAHHPRGRLRHERSASGSSNVEPDTAGRRTYLDDQALRPGAAQRRHADRRHGASSRSTTAQRRARSQLLRDDPNIDQRARALGAHVRRRARHLRLSATACSLATGKADRARRGGRRHRRPVDRRARHAAHDADLPHRWRGRPGHRRRSASRRRAVRGPHAARQGRSLARSRRASCASPRTRARAAPSPIVGRRRHRGPVHVVPSARPPRPVIDGQEVRPVMRSSRRGPRRPEGAPRDQGRPQTQLYLVEEVQKVYRDQGVSIHDKHVELIVRQMTCRIGVQEPGDTDFLPGERVDQKRSATPTAQLVEEGKRPAEGRPELMGITKASLATDSWLSAASFQETTRVLTEAAIDGRGDNLVGLEGEHHHRQADPRRHGHVAGTASSRPALPTTSRWSSGRLTRPPTSRQPPGRLPPGGQYADVVEIVRRGRRD